MYAIISDSGRQYRVEAGQQLDIDYRDRSTGDEIVFERVLVLSGENGVQIGRPQVAGAAVTAKVLGVHMGPKLVVQKLRRRKNSRRKTGHRQMYTRVQVEQIKA